MDEEQGPGEFQLADPAEKLILLVDDDESFLELLYYSVKKEGFRAERATDGAKALRKAEASTPDLMLLDMMLPYKAGFEVIRGLQATDAARTPIIVVTGRDLDRGQIELIRGEANVREFMRKPLRVALLAATIHGLLRTRPPRNDRSSGRDPTFS